MFDPRRFLSNSSVYRSCQSRIRSDDTASRIRDEFLKITPGQRVLDIGCGPAVARRHFKNVNAIILHDLIAVPYTHCILEAQIPFFSIGEDAGKLS
jgi:hypothetical protein